MPASDTLAATAQQLIAEHPACGEVRLRVAGVLIRVSSNSAVLLAALSEYFRDFIDDAAGDDAPLDILALEAPPPAFAASFVPYPPGPGKTKIKDEYIDYADGRIVRKRLTQMAFLFGDVPSIAIGPCIANSNQVVNFVNNRFIQWHLDRGFLLCHAAGVARGGRGLLLAGLAGRGKSTLSLHLLSIGLDFVSNDRLLIRRGADGVVEMVGVAKLPRVNPGTILHNEHLVEMFSDHERARFEQLSPEALWELEHKYDVDVSRRFGDGRFTPRATLAAAAVLTWTRAGGTPRVEAADLEHQRELLNALRKSPGVHYWPRPGYEPDLSEAAYLQHLAGVPSWEIGGGVDFAAAAEACMRLI